MLLAADGSMRTPIVTAGDTQDPNWDPTGSSLAFTRRINKRTDVYMAGADGSGLTQITDTPRRWEFAPSWAPDGSRLAYSRTVGRDSLTIQNLWTIAPDGSDPDKVSDTSRIDEIGVDWQPV